MRNIAALMPVAAKLLLYYLDADGETVPPKEQMLYSGLGRTQYFEAKAQLRDQGYIDARGNLIWTPGAFTKRPEQAPVVAPPPPQPATPAAPVERPPDPVPEGLDYFSELAAGYTTPRQMCMRVDMLPWSGDPQELMRGGSPAQRRKQEQVLVVQALTRHLLGLDLSNRDAKQLLTATSECAEDTLDLIEELKRRIDGRGLKLDAPGRYLLKMATNDSAKRVATAARPAADSPVGAVETGDKPFRDEKYERMQARFKALGLNKREEGE